MKFVRRYMAVGLAAGVVALFGVAVVHAGTQDFTIDSFDATYTLHKDKDSVSTMDVSEHIVAAFPEFDQNHGILRALPEVYDDHSLELALRSVSNAGVVYPYETSEDNDNLVLKIGDAGSYVHGRHAYDVNYGLRGVIKDFGDHQELYWNVNGTQWQQLFGRVGAKLVLGDGLERALTGKEACYIGVVGSTTPCTISHKPDGKTIDFTSDSNLYPHETMSIVLAFKPGTFAAYKPSDALVTQRILQGVAITGPILLAVVFVAVGYRRHGRDDKAGGVIVPQYTPPKDVNVLQSSMVLREKFESKSIAATIIDLAVRHYLKVYEVKKEKLFKDQTTYELEIVRDVAKLTDQEREVLAMLFETSIDVGSRAPLTTTTTSDSKYVKAVAIGKEVEKWTTDNDYFRVAPSRAKLPYMAWSFILFAAGFAFMPWTLGLIGAAAILFLSAGAMPARTLKGAELREYLLGLNMYMKLAEADRLRELQSPHGELTEKIDVNDKTQLVKLYEHLLPYAMLFGIEKDWAKELAPLYEQQPDWYAGSSTFNAIYFASALNSFSAATTTSFSPPSNSSSSGFGGGAGGGGGGGGGGGW